MNENYTSHYGRSLQPGKLFPWAAAMAESIRAKFFAPDVPERIYPILIYTGMSGVTTATAIMAHFVQEHAKARIGMMYIRKENELSHGSRVESSLSDGIFSNEQIPVFIFVDDFVDGGLTAARVISKAAQNLSREIPLNHVFFALSYDDTHTLRKIDNTHPEGSPKGKDAAKLIKYHVRREWLLWKRNDNKRRRESMKAFNGLFHLTKP